MNSGAEVRYFQDHRIPPEVIERQLERILASSGFARAERLKNFLRFIVEQTVDGKGNELKESVIGVAVYGRNPDYNPHSDPTVRVEAGKLRVRLDEYYGKAGKSDPIRIELPKGRYAPVISRRSQHRVLRWAGLVSAAVFLFAVLGFVAWKRAYSISSRQPVVSIAVLPFVNSSSDSADEYLADGMTEEIIHTLAGVEGLHVVSQTSTFAFKSKQPELREVAAKLRVGHVVEGSVRKAGETLRITAQLIRVADDMHLWSGTFDRPSKDVLATQEEIARKIVTTLRVKLEAPGRPLTKRYTENLEAYNLYLQGRYFWHKWEPAATWKALDYFQQAIAQDPNYAPAYAGVAYSYQRLLSAMGSGGVAIPQGSEKMRAAAEKALAIDPLLPEALGVLGIYNERRNDLIEAEKNFQKALEIDPQNVLVRRWHGAMLSTAGRSEEAVREVSRSMQIDPLSPDGHAILAGVLFEGGRNDEAIASCQKALELDPNFHRARWQLGRIYVHKGMYREGIENLLTSEKAGGREAFSPWLGYAYGVAGRKPEAVGILGRQLQRKEGPHYAAAIAMIYTGLGEKDRAIEWLAKSPHFGPSTPEWNSLHGDARFEALARKERRQ